MSYSYFCSSKSTASLIEQLVKHKEWVATNVPKARFRILRCDFGSEYAVQGRGDDYLTAALSRFSVPTARIFVWNHAHRTRTLSTKSKALYTILPVTPSQTHAAPI